MCVQISEAVNRVWTMQRDYCNAIESAGFRNLHTEKPHIAIEYLLSKFKPYAKHWQMVEVV